MDQTHQREVQIYTTTPGAALLTRYVRLEQTLTKSPTLALDPEVFATLRALMCLEK